MQAILVPVNGGRPIRLEKDVTVVGRRRWVCDIYLDDPTISKFHCLVMRSADEMFYVRDLGSANGTQVNGRKITEEALLDGDEVSFANLSYHLRLVASASDSVSFINPPTNPDQTIEVKPSDVPPSGFQTIKPDGQPNVWLSPSELTSDESVEITDSVDFDDTRDGRRTV